MNIASIQEAEKYLRGELYKDLFSFTSVSVLGLFSPAMTSGKLLLSLFFLFNFMFASRVVNTCVHECVCLQF